MFMFTSPYTSVFNCVDLNSYFVIKDNEHDEDCSCCIDVSFLAGECQSSYHYKQYTLACSVSTCGKS